MSIPVWTESDCFELFCLIIVVVVPQRSSEATKSCFSREKNRFNFSKQHLIVTSIKFIVHLFLVGQLKKIRIQILELLLYNKNKNKNN